MSFSWLSSEIHEEVLARWASQRCIWLRAITSLARETASELTSFWPCDQRVLINSSEFMDVVSAHAQHCNHEHVNLHPLCCTSL